MLSAAAGIPNNNVTQLGWEGRARGPMFLYTGTPPAVPDPMGKNK